MPARTVATDHLRHGVEPTVAGSGTAAGNPRPFDPTKHCGAKTNRLIGERPCRQAKGAHTDHVGTGHCWLHGGRSPNGKSYAATEAVTHALVRLGLPITTNPQQALLDLVSEAAGNVAFLRAQAGGMGVNLTIAASEVAVRPSGEVVEVHSRVVTVREEIRAIVKLYGEWCDRLAKYAGEAIKAGIAEREIALVEAQADLVARVIVRALEGLPDAEFERRKVLAMDELVRVKAIPGSRN